MYSLSIRETYQRGMTTRVKNNGEISTVCRDLEEVNKRIRILNRDLKKMDILDIRRGEKETIIRFFKPNKVGLITRVITTNTYNPPAKEEEFSFI